MHTGEGLTIGPKTEEFLDDDSKFNWNDLFARLTFLGSLQTIDVDGKLKETENLEDALIDAGQLYIYTTAGRVLHFSLQSSSITSIIDYNHDEEDDKNQQSSINPSPFLVLYENEVLESITVPKIKLRMKTKPQKQSIWSDFSFSNRNSVVSQSELVNEHGSLEDIENDSYTQFPNVNPKNRCFRGRLIADSFSNVLIIGHNDDRDGIYPTKSDFMFDIESNLEKDEQDGAKIDMFARRIAKGINTRQLFSLENRTENITSISGVNNFVTNVKSNEISIDQILKKDTMQLIFWDFEPASGYYHFSNKAPQVSHIYTLSKFLHSKNNYAIHSYPINSLIPEKRFILPSSYLGSSTSNDNSASETIFLFKKIPSIDYIGLADIQQYFFINIIKGAIIPTGIYYKNLDIINSDIKADPIMVPIISLNSVLLIIYADLNPEYKNDDECPYIIPNISSKVIPDLKKNLEARLNSFYIIKKGNLPSRVAMGFIVPLNNDDNFTKNYESVYNKLIIFENRIIADIKFIDPYIVVLYADASVFIHSIFNLDLVIWKEHIPHLPATNSVFNQDYRFFLSAGLVDFQLQVDKSNDFESNLCKLTQDLKSSSNYNKTIVYNWVVSIFNYLAHIADYGHKREFSEFSSLKLLIGGTVGTNFTLDLDVLYTINFSPPDKQNKAMSLIGLSNSLLSCAESWELVNLHNKWFFSSENRKEININITGICDADSGNFLFSIFKKLEYEDICLTRGSFNQTLLERMIQKDNSELTSKLLRSISKVKFESDLALERSRILKQFDMVLYNSLIHIVKCILENDPSILTLIFSQIFEFNTIRFNNFIPIYELDGDYQINQAFSLKLLNPISILVPLLDSNTKKEIFSLMGDKDARSINWSLGSQTSLRRKSSANPDIRKNMSNKNSKANENLDKFIDIVLDLMSFAEDLNNSFLNNFSLIASSLMEKVSSVSSTINNSLDISINGKPDIVSFEDILIGILSLKKTKTTEFKTFMDTFESTLLNYIIDWTIHSRPSTYNQNLNSLFLESSKILITDKALMSTLLSLSTKKFYNDKGYSIEIFNKANCLQMKQVFFPNMETSYLDSLFDIWNDSSFDNNYNIIFDNKTYELVDLITNNTISFSLESYLEYIVTIISKIKDPNSNINTINYSLVYFYGVSTVYLNNLGFSMTLTDENESSYYLIACILFSFRLQIHSFISTLKLNGPNSAPASNLRELQSGLYKFFNSPDERAYTSPLGPSPEDMIEFHGDLFAKLFNSKAIPSVCKIIPFLYPQDKSFGFNNKLRYQLNTKPIEADLINYLKLILSKLNNKNNDKIIKTFYRMLYHIILPYVTNNLDEDTIKSLFDELAISSSTESLNLLDRYIFSQGCGEYDCCRPNTEFLPEFSISSINGMDNWLTIRYNTIQGKNSPGKKLFSSKLLSYYLNKLMQGLFNENDQHVFKYEAALILLDEIFMQSAEVSSNNWIYNTRNGSLNKQQNILYEVLKAQNEVNENEDLINIPLMLKDSGFDMKKYWIEVVSFSKDDILSLSVVFCWIIGDIYNSSFKTYDKIHCLIEILSKFPEITFSLLEYFSSGSSYSKSDCSYKIGNGSISYSIVGKKLLFYFLDFIKNIQRRDNDVNETMCVKEILTCVVNNICLAKFSCHECILSEFNKPIMKMCPNHLNQVESLIISFLVSEFTEEISTEISNRYLSVQNLLNILPNNFPIMQYPFMDMLLKIPLEQSIEKRRLLTIRLGLLKKKSLNLSQKVVQLEKIITHLR